MNLQFLFQSPLSDMLAFLLFSVSMITLIKSVRGFRRAYQLRGEYACAIWILRSIRFLLISLALLAWAAGIFWAQTWLLIISLVIIAQEIYEGAVLSQILKMGNEIEEGRAVKL